MIKKDARTALRLPCEQRQMIDELVQAGKFKNLSEVIRQALSEFLKQN
jgi:Arc/MetJ-type ribon-helix-helix transcriptional regulator